ncbi:hypothetical protein K466DRAFT_657252, partial [Polyporus arcularius HHB13444]
MSGILTNVSVMESPSLWISSPLSLLPLELEYAILGWLQEDRPAAASCSRVCRRWRPIGQSMLFQTVKLQRSRDVKAPQFLQFVSANLDIAGFVHALHLDGYYKLSVEALRIALDTIPAASASFDVAHMAHPRRSLKKLAIVYCGPLHLSSDNDIANLLSVVCMFSEIGHLAVKGDKWATVSDIDGYLKEAPVVRSLKVYTRIETMLRASDSLRGGRMSYLGICAKTIAAAVAQADLVREAGPHLRTLKLSLYYTNWDDVSVGDVCHALDLSTCTALQALHLHFTVFDEEV